MDNLVNVGHISQKKKANEQSQSSTFTTFFVLYSLSTPLFCLIYTSINSSQVK